MTNKASNKNRETLAFNTNPGLPVTFTVDTDKNKPYSVTGGDNGKIAVQDNVISYTPNEGFNGTEELTCEYEKEGRKIVLIVTVKVGYSFKAKSHILSLLGDELIGSDNLAIFELVKNAYDADAEQVSIVFNNLNTPQQSITVEDDGSGMALNILRTVWLEIGTDYKRGEKRKPSHKFKRISLGEKGVGRLAVHKLGRSITLETQPEGSKESYRLSLNWQQLMDDYEYINDTIVEIKTVKESLFKKNKGTRITINDLKKEVWERRDLKDLTRKVNSIISPFKQVKGAFDVNITANNNHQDWIDEVKKVDAILNDSVYFFDFVLKKDPETEFANLSWTYKFTPPKSFEIGQESIDHPDKSASNPKEDSFFNVFVIKPEEPIFHKEQKHLLNSDLNGIGEISGRFYVYNLLGIVLRSFGQTQAIKSFVRENCGIKVFRDGIRVYNYGETGDDWLGLDLSRIQRLGDHFSKNTTIGSIEISQEGSFQNLKEKTNREGFDENPTFLKFRNICKQIFTQFENIAQKNRDALGEYVDGLKPVKQVGLPDTIIAINEKLAGSNLEKEISPFLKRIEKDYNTMRDVMLNSGMTGINLGIVFHEVDREMRFINTDLKNNVDIENIKQRVRNLIQLLENFSPILKQNTHTDISAIQLVERAKQINNPRFQYHKIIFSSPLITKENEDFQISGPGNLLISALSNLIDNSIYWVSEKKELEKEKYKPAIYVGSDLKHFNGPAIIVADNGTGFKLEPEDLIMPYRTTRPGGMGLGLYYVNMVMGLIGGKLIFPERNEVLLPDAYDGAVIALVFPKR
jgi:hypothetical protein